MPVTVNGVGTRYYGKKNISVRTAACASCQRIGALESYDTRLWFVILFIPIIPLGRKRIIDECPSCRRHFVAGADAYEQAKQLQTSGAMEHYHREPSPETALAAHAQLLSFHEHDQAVEFRAAALQRFRSHAGLRVGLAQHLQQMGSFQESDQLFKEAYELAPNDPGARTGVASRTMDEGDLDGARRLLDFMEEGGAGQLYSLGPLDVLAGYYQRAGRHDEALQLSAILLRELPSVGNQHSFRSFVRKSEKALGRRDSILPARQGSLLGLFRAADSPYAPWQRKLAIATLVVALAVLGLALNNEYIRKHRTLFVVNGFDAPVQVQVDNEPAATVSGLGKIAVAEGPHTIHVSGPVDETHNVELSTGYFDRWFRTPAWVVNPGGEAILQEVHLVYAATPRPSRQRLIVGQSFFAAPHYDYVFDQAPPTMNVQNQNAEVVKTRLDWMQGHEVETFYSLRTSDRSAALEFAQRRLKRHPEPKGLLKAYLASATAEELPQVQAFLRSSLDARPVNVSWHRAYQSIAESTIAEGELLALYDRYLAAEPGSAPLLYLRGRIEPDDGKQTAYFRRAQEADGSFAWPWIGLAAQAESWGRWQEAITALRKAEALPLEDTELFDELMHAARLGLGEADALVRAYRARLDANALAPIGVVYLLDALAAAGKSGEIDAAYAAWESRLPAEAQAQVGPQMKALRHYLKGEAQACLDACGQLPGLQDSPIRAHALMALGKARQAAEEPALANIWNDPWNALALSVAFSVNGQPDEAAQWRDRARDKSRQPHVAEVFAAAQAPSLESLGKLRLRIAEKALALTALAAQFPARQDEFLALAAKLNIRRTAPYLLVQRAVDRKFGPTP